MEKYFLNLNCVQIAASQLYFQKKKNLEAFKNFVNGKL